MTAENIAKDLTKTVLVWNLTDYICDAIVLNKRILNKNIQAQGASNEYHNVCFSKERKYKKI